ncbi:heavy metal-binding domain-containing protein [Rubrobacter indicoceani]|uniref:heavy metal-binding domain-containing protein n=1 Tax=Rubrobacter indicoceani TaxID=2051957 RepID=UPI0019697736|nr:heavy metal-binding domain-containing protein [Rubrobacter indicoceani]
MLRETGARGAGGSWFGRLLSRAVSRDLQAFVVPGEDIARARGLDLEGLGFGLADNPRRADVLVLVGGLPPGLKRAAAIAYAQMPRPRAIFAIGAGDASPLPEPEVSVAPDRGDRADIKNGVEALRGLFARSAFREGASDFDIAEVRTQTEYTCAMHPEVVREEPGSCPVCGMDLIPREAAGGGPEHNSDDQHEGHEGPEHDSSNSEAEPENDGNDMDHGDMDFMSMIEMTKDLPRSRDGLPMEWVEAPFGPLFPGLPGGLSLSLTFDGDAVTEVRATSPVGARLESLSGPVEDFPERLARLNPLSPVACRLLALRALEDLGGSEPGEDTLLARNGALERERVASHLGWLAGLGRLLGQERLRRRAAKLQIALLRPGRAGEMPGFGTEVRGVIHDVRRTPLLGRRLRGVGVLPAGSRTFGPVARASREESDALCFEPVVLGGGDALARLQVRLAELEWSLSVLDSPQTGAEPPVGPVRSGEGSAVVETPRGAARLRVRLEDGIVEVVELSTPSTAHLRLIRGLADDTELADFLISVHSLDISPWEVVL